MFFYVNYVKIIILLRHLHIFPYTATINPSDLDAPSETISPQSPIDGQLTVDFIRQSSWKQLTHSYSSASKEDYHVSEIINDIDGAQEFVNLSYGGIDRNLVDATRFKEKIESVLQVYHSSHSKFKLNLEYDILNDSYVQVTVQSKNYKHVVNGIGLWVYIKHNAKFYESAENGGSGACGTGKNKYVPKNRLVRVNGVAYLDSNNSITSFDYYGFNFNGCSPIDIHKKRMLSICTYNGREDDKEAYDLGWIDPKYVLML